MIKFGINSTDLESTAQNVGSVLAISFWPHESDHRGGNYYRAEAPQGTIFIQRNYDPLDQEPFEAGWPRDQIVLYFDGLDDKAWRTSVLALESVQELNLASLS